MKQIPLTQDKVALVADDTYEWAKIFKWFAFKNKHIFYAGRQFQKNGGKQHILFLHQCIIGFPLNGNEIDHIDGNGLNDQRDNLRIVDSVGNNRNTIKHRKGKLVGTSWNKQNKRWRSQASIDGEIIYLGNYKTEQEAHEVYLKYLEECAEKKGLIC